MSEELKVYELAKELGTDSISLLDKLKGLDIQVKSHMSSLTPDQVTKARDSLAQKPKTKAKAKTKTKTKAKAKTKTAGAATTVRKKTATVVKRKTGAAVKTATKAKPAEEEVAEKPAPSRPSTIIRKRATPAAAPAPAAPATSGDEEAAKAAAKEAQLKAQQEAQLKAVEEAAQAEAEMKKAEAVDRANRGLPPAPKPEPTEEEEAPAPRKPSLKFTELAKPASSLNIIARPDPKEQARAKEESRKRPPGQRIIKMSKEKLDQMAEEEAAKKRGGPGGKSDFIKPEDVRFNDYRKKEMVFLPKRKKIPVGKTLNKPQITTPKATKRIVEMHDTVSVGDLANQMGIKASQVIKKLISMGQMATVNQAIDFDTATLIGEEFKYEVRNVAFKEEAMIEKEPEDKAEDLVTRPPIVTIMGHVDHGKTSLLDAIRDANVVAKEAGGITQHIGAYTITKDGKMITFIDTPGHEAFSVMRARGANVTDIVVLVVASDDGVMPQTREAVNHAKAAGVPIVVAVNKMDKPDANPDRVKQELAELELLPEDWGGQTMYVPVSALKKTGLDEILEAINLNAEVLELKANPKAKAQGSVLEARLEKGKGPVASLLVTRGTMKQGDPMVVGETTGRIRAMVDHTGKPIKEVLPGMAAEVLGLSGTPNAGDHFHVCESESDAKKIVGNRKAQAEKAAQTTSKMSLDELFAKIQSGESKELKVVVKADVFGSVEAVKDSLEKLTTEKVKVNVIHSAPGGITESDVLLASASNAVIVGFNVRPETKARRTAEGEGIAVHCYNVIYELIDEIKKAMTGLLDKKKVEKFLGRAEVRQTFSVPKVGVVAGTAVVDGKILRGANVRLLREERIIFEGKMNSLKRFKDDAKEVQQGYECGIGLEDYNDIKPGDIIEAYEVELVQQEL